MATATAGVGGRRAASCILVGEGANVLPEARIIAITKMRIGGWLLVFASGRTAAGRQGLDSVTCPPPLHPYAKRHLWSVDR